MDGNQFDDLTRSIAASTSRRRLVKGVAAGIAAAAVAAFGGDPAGASYRRRCTTASGAVGRLCAGVCIEVSSDPVNCGSCGHVCPGGTFCCNGWCAGPAQNSPGCCPPSLSCGGVCTSPYDDPANCGACGNVCGADQDCCSGQCLTRGTDQNCELCYGCGGGFVCDPNANGPGAPGCVCPPGADCAFQ